MTLRTLVSPRGRIPRATFCIDAALVLAVFLALFAVLDRLSRGATLALAALAAWALVALSVKRLHDRGKSPAWLLLALLPLVGPLWLGIELAFLPGVPGENRYGADPLASGGDYLQVTW